MRWDRIAQALSFYQSRGYKYCEVPWTVPRDITLLTFKKTPSWVSPWGDLVGSAEQSLLSIGGHKSSEGIVAVTPCFREDDFDQTHSPYFLKVELMRKGDCWEVLMDAAEEFLSSLGLSLSIEPTESGADLTCRGIEVGSYSYNPGLDYSCGTGYASPRTEMAEEE